MRYLGAIWSFYISLQAENKRRRVKQSFVTIVLRAFVYGEKSNFFFVHKINMLKEHLLRRMGKCNEEKSSEKAWEKERENESKLESRSSRAFLHYKKREYKRRTGVCI